MKKKKRKPPKKAARPNRSKQTPSRLEPPPINAPFADASNTSARPSVPAAPRPALGRLHRATLTPAGLRGRDLVRFLRIHVKQPYGKRGQEAIRQLAVEVGHLGNLELNTQAQAGDDGFESSPTAPAL